MEFMLDFLSFLFCLLAGLHARMASKSEAQLFDAMRAPYAYMHGKQIRGLIVYVQQGVRELEVGPGTSWTLALKPHRLHSRDFVRRSTYTMSCVHETLSSQEIFPSTESDPSSPVQSPIR